MKIFGQHDEQTIIQFQRRARAAPWTPRSWRTGTSATSCRSAASPRIGSRCRSSASASTSRAATPPSAPTSRSTRSADSPTRCIARSPASPTRSRTRVSFGIGRQNRADDAPVDHPLFEDPAWDAVPPKHRQALRDEGAPAARHRRQRQPLRRRLRRRDGRALGRRALRQPRLRAHGRVGVPRAGAGKGVGRARAGARGAARRSARRSGTTTGT